MMGQATGSVLASWSNIENKEVNIIFIKKVLYANIYVLYKFQ